MPVAMPPVLQLSFRVPASRAVGPGMFVVDPADGLSVDACWRLLEDAAQVAFLVHGFNVSWESGRDSLRNLGAALRPAFGGLVIAVTWPGDSGLGPLGYPWEGQDADDTGLALAKLITAHVRDGAELSFVTHSLGARVALEACARLDPDRWLLREVCVTAPAVDDTCFNTDERYFGVASAARRTTVLASTGDRVLQLAYPAGDLVQSWLFRWKDKAGRALGRRGPRNAGGRLTSPKVRHEQIPDPPAVGHGDYITSGTPNDFHKACYGFARQVVDGDAAPAWTRGG
jgi:hypothetical protein